MSQPFNKVSIIGSGNVATHLSRALIGVGIKVTHVCSRNLDNRNQLAQEAKATACSIDELPNNQWTLICVSDDVIIEAIEQLPEQLPVAYTSGSVGLDQLLPREKIGVFYPLQTLSKEKSVDYSSIPLLVESNNTEFEEQLLATAQLITENSSIVNSQQRRKLHLAAVWINNFTNHIVYQAQKIAKEQEVDFNLLLPLLKETIAKLEDQSAFDAQTGPARRGDENTIEKHLNELQGSQKEIYQILSKSIKETYND